MTRPADMAACDVEARVAAHCTTARLVGRRGDICRTMRAPATCVCTLAPRTMSACVETDSAKYCISRLEPSDAHAQPFSLTRCLAGLASDPSAGRFFGRGLALVSGGFGTDLTPLALGLGGAAPGWAAADFAAGFGLALGRPV